MLGQLYPVIIGGNRKNMKKKIIDHWCIYYVWYIRRHMKWAQTLNDKNNNKVSKDKILKLSKDAAGRMVLIPILLYLAIYIGVPFIVYFFGSSKVVRENKWFIVIVISLIIGFYVYPAVNANAYIKEKIDELMSIEDWDSSVYKKKGRRYFWFHHIFPFVSMGLIAIIMIFLYDMFGIW